ncbi:VWA domain-containing protein [Kineosporia sp. R_H_3]|uniref:VWA domain-containing protein n=1 Tax=Kineosporia sp. R_H_3 TaxID=1961848 RepID=UPI000B4AE914|nr:VWA domain-containing protein [Kineosporia sp. R_H_3]
MGRHTPGSRRQPRRRGRRLVAALAVLAVASGGAVVAQRTGALDLSFVQTLRGATSPDCTPTVIRVAASPAMTPAVNAVLAPAQGRALSDGTCLRVDVQGVDPDQVVAATRAAKAATLPEELARLPHLWIPDSSIWVARAARAVPLAREGSLATSPVVLATSEASAKALKWSTDDPPAWAQAVTTGWPVSVDLTTDTCGLATAFALRASLGDTPQYRRALAALSLSVSQGNTVGLQAPLDLVSENSPATPILPSTEQSVLALRRGGLASLTMIYPKDGSPFLDYPLVRVADGRWGPTTEALAKSVAAELTSAGAGATYAAQGFRLEDGGAPDGEGVRTEKIRALPVPDAKTVGATITALTTLAAPTRMLALIDVSTSMNIEARPGVKRIDLVRDAATAALTALPPDNSVGAWMFASKIEGDVDYKQLAAVDRLDAPDQGRTHRAAILELLKALPRQTRDGGTSIYDTVDAAVAEMQASYDGRASNVVVLLTDGRNLDSTGLTLDEVVSRLEKGRAKGAVRLIAIGIGGDTDLPSLRRLAAATPGGQAYQARDPADLQAVLLDALARRG